MRTDYNHIVLGCGGIGAGALFWLARRAGGDVLGLEQFKLFHHNGSSQDRSRIIRLIYHKRDYARLMPHAYAAWETVEAESGVRIVTQTGGVMVVFAGTEHEQKIDVYAESLAETGATYEWMDRAELRRRFPQFTPEAEVRAFYQEKSGLVDPQHGNGAHIALARGHGATILDECPVQSIAPTADGVEVRTAQGTFACQKLIVTAGAWSGELLKSVGLELPLRVSQEQVTYFSTPHLKEFSAGRFPIWQWKDASSYYGFPIYGEVATKAAIDNSGETVTASTRTFEPNAQREAQLVDFLERNVPRSLGPKLYTKTCLYTMPLDRDFILDALPGEDRIVMAVGAGHAYKFASLLGRILSELAIDGETKHDISAFTLRRPAILQPEAAAYAYY